MTDFRDRKVLVTGAGNGIGLLMAERIAMRGGRLVLWDVDAVALEKARARVACLGDVLAVDACDLSDRGSIEAAAARVIGEHGGVDVLINNAGIVSGKRLLEDSDESIVKAFSVNTLALFRTVRAFLPGMIAARSATS